ncbi:MAG: hypothetical protein CM15mV55_820 [uncultured marine virus]|nr:MAG: hypothetical protein CM15mV55_820 [uncultured marine virus]
MMHILLLEDELQLFVQILKFILLQDQELLCIKRRNSAGSNTVDYLVVAGGGAGGRGALVQGNAGEAVVVLEVIENLERQLLDVMLYLQWGSSQVQLQLYQF